MFGLEYSMSHTISVQQAAQNLPELIGSLGPGDEILLTQNDRAVARITPSGPARRRKPGGCKGMLIINAEDDDHLADFKEYMP